MNTQSEKPQSSVIGRILKACVRFFTRTFGGEKKDDALLRQSQPPLGSSEMPSSGAKPKEPAQPVEEPAPEKPKEEYIDRGKPVPDEYGRDVLRVFARDPSWLFVYWELSPERLKSLHNEYADLHTCTWQLRITDTSDNAAKEVSIFLSAYNWYVNVTPRHEYKAELGFIHNDTFVSILTSGTVRMPGDAISERSDEEWMVLRRDIMKMMHLRSEADLLGPEHSHTSADRFEELTSEQRELLKRQAEEARKLSSSGGASSAHPLSS